MGRHRPACLGLPRRVRLLLGGAQGAAGDRGQRSSLESLPTEEMKNKEQTVDKLKEEESSKEPYCIKVERRGKQ